MWKRVPTVVSSPTQQPDLTAGRITQSTSEITAAALRQADRWVERYYSVANKADW